MQGMAGTTRRDAPVVATWGDVELRWHAAELRGERSLAQAARELGVNRDELSRIERGETVQIRFETLAKLVSGYHCSLEDLLEVSTRNDGTAAPWAGPLAAIQEGRVRAGLPRRPDPATVTDVDELMPSAGARRELAAVATFGDDEDTATGRVRRSAFRPTR